MQKPTPTPPRVSLPTCAERASGGRTDTKLRPKANSLVILQLRLFPFPVALCGASAYLPPAKDPAPQMLNPMNSSPCPGKEAKTLLFLKAEASVPTNIQYLPLPLTGKLSRAEMQGKGKILTDRPINLSVLCQRRRFPESTRRGLRAPAPTRKSGPPNPRFLANGDGPCYTATPLPATTPLSCLGPRHLLNSGPQFPGCTWGSCGSLAP